MNSQTSLVAHQYRLQRWVGMVRECNSRPAGMMVNDWCVSIPLQKLITIIA